MAESTTVVELLADVEDLIVDKNPDLRSFSLDPNTDAYHTHTIDDIPQLAMLLNTARMSEIYDSYYDISTGNGFVFFSNRILLNFGSFIYNNNNTQTKVLLPLSYYSNNNYILQINRVATYSDDNRSYEPLDNTYNIYNSEKNAGYFIVKCNQLYIPERVKFNYFTFGVVF